MDGWKGADKFSQRSKSQYRTSLSPGGLSSNFQWQNIISNFLHFLAVDENHGAGEIVGKRCLDDNDISRDVLHIRPLSVHSV